MQHDPDEALWQALSTQEAALDRAALDCAAHLRLPLSRADRRALNRGLQQLSDRLMPVTLAANRIRFSQGAAPPGSRRIDNRHRSLSDLDARLRKLVQLMARYRRIMAARPQPLYPPDDLRDLRSEQSMASDRVHVALNRVLNPESQEAAAESFGCYPDIPLPPSRFMTHAHAAYRVTLVQRRPEPLRFLDVGCGGGLKVLLAAEFFARADGLEYDAGYAAAARRVIDRAGRLPSQVIHGDALTFDRYGDYDVIYFYQPMKSPEGLIALERQITAQARPGTLLIAPYGLFSGRAESLGCGRVDGAVYLTQTSSPEARAVCRQAEHIGIEIPRPDDRKYVTNGYLKTLIDACHAVGYEVV